MSKGASQSVLVLRVGCPSSCQEIPTRRDDQGASDEDLGYGVNGGAYYCTQDDQKFDPVAPLPQPHSNHTSKFPTITTEYAVDSCSIAPHLTYV
jgi:hypothetical protein